MGKPIAARSNLGPSFVALPGPVPDNLTGVGEFIHFVMSEMPLALVNAQSEMVDSGTPRNSYLPETNWIPLCP